MDETQIELKFSPELEELLAKNGTNLVRELQNMGMDVRRGSAVSGGTGEKSAALILLAAIPLTAAIGSAVATIVRELARRPIKLKEGESVVTPTGTALETKTNVKVGKSFEYTVDHNLGQG